MRLISDEALDLIAGGYMPVITVVGYPDPDPGGGIGTWYPGGFGGGYAGSGEASHPASHIPTAEEQPEQRPTHSSAIPAHVPAWVNMNDLRNVAVLTGYWMMREVYDQKIEHGSIIIRYPDGTIGSTKIQHGDQIEVKMSYQPKEGEKIIGYIHTHPASEYYSQTTPSPDDFKHADMLRKHPAADLNLMIYIADIKTGGIYEYDRDAYKNPKYQGPNINADMSFKWP